MPCPCGECQDNKVDLSETLLINPDRTVGNTVTSDSSAPKYLDPLYIVLSNLGDVVFHSKEDLNVFLTDDNIYLDVPLMTIVEAGCVRQMKLGAL